MALDNRYIPDISLSEFLIDPETGEPITGGTVEFFEDEDRSQPKNVFQLTGSPPNYTYDVLPNPMDVVAGIPVNESGVNVAIYYFPYDELGNIQNYYVVVKNADGVIVNEREAWPNLTAGEDPTQTQNNVSNELDNSQFVEVLFNPTYGLTLPTGGAVSDAMYEIAPQWFLKVSSNADATILIERTSLEGSLNIETNPPYQLEITPEGGNITSLQLVQRLNRNPDIWANGYISASLVATSLDGISHTIEGIYAPNVSAAATTIFSETTGSTGYVRMEATVQLPAGTNTDNSDIGYVDFIINLPVIGAVAVTSVQVVGLEANQENVAYEQQPVNRQESLLFGYYNPLIQQVPVPSILQGWDFKVNPAQWGATQALGSIGTGSAYIWDQLIGWQNDSGVFSAQRGSPTCLEMVRYVAGSTALIQYLSGAELRQLLSNDFSVTIKALTDLVGGAAGTVSFWATTDATLPNVAAGTNQSLIATLDANGKPSTFHGTWTEIPRNYRGDARFTISNQYSQGMQTIALEGWNKTSRTLDATYTYAAIVVGFAPCPTPCTVAIDSISVTPGLLARPVSPLSYNLTLAELQYYYEKSYGKDVNPGAVTDVNALLFPTIGTVSNAGITISINLQDFYVKYQQEKRVIDSIFTPYSPRSATSGQFATVSYTDNVEFAVETWSYSSYFQLTAAIGSNGAGNQNPKSLVPTFSSTTTGNLDSFLFLHYTADARLGIVL